MLGSVLGSHPGVVLVHAVFPGNFGCLGPVVNFLELAESLINNRLDIGTSPHHTPFLLSIGDFTEPIILKSVPDELDFKAIVELEVELTVLWLVGSYGHRIDVRP